MKAFELLSDESKWHKGPTSAVNQSGLPVPSKSPDACRWCIWGALNRCYPNHLAFLRIAANIARRVGYSSDTDLFFWNDRVATYNDVVSVLKEMDA